MTQQTASTSFPCWHSTFYVEGANKWNNHWSETAFSNTERTWLSLDPVLQKFCGKTIVLRLLQRSVKSSAADQHLNYYILYKIITWRLYSKRPRSVVERVGIVTWQSPVKYITCVCYDVGYYNAIGNIFTNLSVQIGSGTGITLLNMPPVQWGVGHGLLSLATFVVKNIILWPTSP